MSSVNAKKHAYFQRMIPRLLALGKVWGGEHPPFTLDEREDMWRVFLLGCKYGEDHAKPAHDPSHADLPEDDGMPTERDIAWDIGTGL